MSSDKMYLTKFKVRNFKNFDKEVCIDFQQHGNYDFNTEIVDNDQSVITKALMYGPNGSGKSNFCLALFDIVMHLTDNYKLTKSYLQYRCMDSNEPAADFEYTFKCAGHTFVYSYAKANVDVILWERISIDGTDYLEYNFLTEEGYSNFVGSEKLNLNGQSKVSRVKYIISTSVLEDDNEYNELLMKFAYFVNRMLLFYSDNKKGYQGFATGSESIDEGILSSSDDALQLFEQFLRDNGINYNLVEKRTSFGNREIYCRFKYGDIELYRIASTGTRSLELFYYWYLKMKKMSLVAIDEFDAYYHFELAENIVKLLRGLTDTQVILTTQNTDLMSNDLLRPDCYYLINDNKITPLDKTTDKELRKAHNLQKMYKAGAFDE